MPTDNVDPEAERGDLPVWTLNSETGEGVLLNGCHIVEVSLGPPVLYKFTKPDIDDTLSESSISPPIFVDFEYLGQKWNVVVDGGLAEGVDAHGRWAIPESEDAGDQGNWTAQAGGDPIGERAASADAS